MFASAGASRVSSLFRLGLLFTLAMLGLIPASAQTGGHWLTGYYAYYNDNVMSPTQMDYTKVTHVIFWPVLPNPDGSLNTSEYRSQAQFNADATALVAAAHAAGVKALIGIGGNSDSGASAGFSGATTAANLPIFVSNIVALMQQFDFDGVDINWEEISAINTSDNTQFTAFIAALRTQLNTITPRPLLTMAPAVTPYQAGTITTQQLIASVYQDFDQLNIQTYIMSGPFCGWETWFNAPLNNGGLDFILAPGEPLPTGNLLIASYVAAGIPISKMALGIQFDSAIWQGGTGTSTGGVTKPHQTWTNDLAICDKTNPDAPNFNTLPYRQMVALETTAGYTVEPMDTNADQNWISYDPSGTGTTNEANDEFISYDSPQSIAKKGTDLLSEEASQGTLGGVFIFELSGDYNATAAAAQQHPLLDAAYGMANLLPGAVTGLTATAGTTSAALSWAAAPWATSYNVYFESSQGSGPASLATTSSTTSATVSGLTPGTTYWFVVEGLDAFGAGATAQVSVAIPATVTSHTPTGVTATAIVNEVLLTWTAVPGATSYQIARSPAFTGANPRVTTVSGYNDTAVTDGQTYTYTIFAVGSWGTGSGSAPVQATPFGPLTAPTGLAATVAPGQVTLTWTATPYATSYMVLRSVISENNFSEIGIAHTTSYVDTYNFTGTTTYYYALIAYNGETIHSPYSAQLAVKALAPLPNAPGTPTAVAGAGQVTLSWNTIPNVLGYYVWRLSPGGAGYVQIATASSTSYVDKTVIGGYTYGYLVQSYNFSGHSPNSPKVAATPTLPAPTQLTAAVANEAVNLSWTGVYGAAGYEVLRGTASGGPYLTEVGTTITATTLTDSLATPGTQFYYVVEAYTVPSKTSPAVFSPNSNQAAAKVIATVPPAPTGLEVFLAQGGGGVNLGWNKVTGATTYNILRSTTNGGPYKLVGSSLYALYTDAPLAAGTYYWVVQAVNSAGTSPNSSQVSFTVTAPNIPPPPGVSVSVFSGEVGINTLGSYGATTYGYYRATAAAGPYTLLQQTAMSGIVDANVVAGNTYYYEMTAGNESGTSAFSAPVSATIPIVPTGLKATPGNAQVTLTWNAVAGATSYNVFQGTAATALNSWVGTSTSNTYIATGLTNGTPYYFGVQTVGADGISTGAVSAAVTATPVAAQTATAWIPDWDGQLLQVRVGTTAITINLPSCNPNSVAVNQNLAYVVCNSNGGNPDKILVYNATTIRAAPAGTLNIAPTQTITSTQFDWLVGIAFDSSNNLWVASSNNNTVLEITAAQLLTANPTPVASLVDSPPNPTGLAFDTDGSLWVTGQYAGGILLNFPPSQFGLGVNANPRYCAVTDPQGGICISQANLFLEPEGVAVFNGSVWVANNSTTGSNGLGGATPGRELVNLTYAGGTLTVAGIYGKTLPDTNPGTATSPFFCPGGLFGTPAHLWLNDESYGEATPQCGATGDSASKTGAVFSFTPAQLSQEPATLAPAFTNITGRPGFGGIFIEND